ncbi:hypothetical protein AXF42_Ash021768 [Apostasia shenzhenica]|uniref:Uncharacterized protein n=1 Tax=Apostasia shenzhenica TaxID=1088818 RepID=A0A2H9ZRZ9_9ASPA|nr:hypothetical protein AXF42_Ash021768 [Apostasia shenzhenica]
MVLRLKSVNHRLLKKKVMKICQNILSFLRLNLVLQTHFQFQKPIPLIVLKERIK